MCAYHIVVAYFDVPFVSYKCDNGLSQILKPYACLFKCHKMATVSHNCRLWSNPNSKL